jgi:hypothetical protein
VLAYGDAAVLIPAKGQKKGGDRSAIYFASLEFSKFPYLTLAFCAGIDPFLQKGEGCPKQIPIRFFKLLKSRKV